MTTHLIDVGRCEAIGGEFVRTETLDLHYFDSRACMDAYLVQHGWDGFTQGRAAGEHHSIFGLSVSWGAAPCAASEPDYAVYCATCGEPMNDYAERNARGGELA